MKQQILLSFLLFCSLAVTTQAQISKGATWLGGQISYGQTKSSALGTSDKTSAFGVSPALGKAVKDNLVVGVSLNYQNYRNKRGSVVTTKGNTYGGGIFIRKYVPIINKLYIFGEARVFFNTFNTEEKLSGGDSKIKGWSIGIDATPGISYALSNKIHIETGANSLFRTRYEKKNQKHGFIESKNNSFNAGVYLDNNSPLYLGFRILLNKKA